MDRPQSNGDPHQTPRNPTARRAAHDGKTEVLEPPVRLTAEEAGVWRSTVQSVRTDWFLGSETVLETFCRLTVIERRLAALVRESDPMEDTDFGALVKLHHGAAMLVGNLAGKLRLTVRSTRERDTQKLPRSSDAWEVEPGPMRS